ncbi:serine hydrolase [Myxococcus sp. K15C18031901]|uniref:serine hydrolase n=1 Tax=Myxococcus dinghuensis TaxID=2906761 RepID=UPI0020A70C51|nr:serine hydrolase [Myxococcus dinghuensis]MCP3100223.1 serine hydrolase [Myxococcus dinghuensis]
MQRTLARLGVVFGLMACALASAASAAPSKAAMDKLAAQYHKLRQFNGTVLVANEGGIVLEKAYGSANFEWQVPNTPDTKFRIGSITKQFTAMVILQLVAEGKLELDAPVTRYLPDYRKDTGDRVTLTHLLNHTSGIPSYTSHPDFNDKVARNPYTVSDFVRQHASGDLAFEPGTQFSYNNSGYFLLGAIIEKVTGKSYAKALQERIFTPVGMKDSGYDVSATVLPKRASGYVLRPTGYLNAPYIDMGLPYAAGSLYSTVGDLYRWDRALSQGKLLPKPLEERMFTPGLRNYAFGWSVKSLKLDDGKTEVATQSHGGGINGFNTFLVRVPASKEVVIVLDNTSRGDKVEELARGLLSILHGVTPRAPRPPIGEVVLERLAKAPVADVVAMYRDLKANKATQYDFSPGQLNTVGYILLRDQRMADALEVFKLNAESYPQDSNAHDSLGEAYLASGDEAKALASYRRSLELDPDNRNAVEVIERLEKKAPKAP